jgi:hypothetical protein
MGEPSGLTLDYAAGGRASATPAAAFIPTSNCERSTKSGRFSVKWRLDKQRGSLLKRGTWGCHNAKNAAGRGLDFR